MAEELWYILTVNSTSSCWPALDVSSSAVPGTVKLPSLELSIRKPSAWIAARWAPLATKVTEWPALASRPPQ